VKAANLALRFALELAALAWATFGSPKARVTLSPPQRIVFEALVFGAAAVALGAAGEPVWGVILFVAWAANRAVLTALDA
jgi:hypothetical protein